MAQRDQGAMLVVPLRATAPEACRASGWGMHRACVSDDGHIVCPLCAKAVVARRDAALGPTVRIIGEHDA
ncbi:MAG: hypothetical protein ACRDJ9_29090 [Dehalococcoidia bacterium]